MKKNFLFGVLALAGLLSSCSHDDTADALQNSESDRVTLTATLPADFATIGTRALPTSPDENYKLRCILEVWTKDLTTLKVRQEVCPNDATPAAFSFELENGDYKALLWASYIRKNTEPSSTTIAGLANVSHYEDYAYFTSSENGLKDVSRSTVCTIPAINDAFCVAKDFTKKATALNDLTATLTRQTTRLIIAEKNTENLKYLAKARIVHTALKSVNVATGEISDVKSIILDIEPDLFDFGKDITIKGIPCKILYTMVFLASDDGVLGEIKFSQFEATEGSGKVLKDITIPAGIPAKRNYCVNAAGNLIIAEDTPSTDVSMTLDINSDWQTDAVEKDADDLVWDGTTTKQPAGYDATSTGTVDITSAAELAWLAETCNAGTKFDGYTFRLTTDINLNKHEWTPIGSSLNSFYGKFDGQHHTVSNLKCTVSQYSGLFGFLESAEVKDVTVSGALSYVATSQFCYLGGIAGACQNKCTISGCTNRCNITVTDDTRQGYVGGITGKATDYTALSDNTNTGTLSTNNHAESAAGGIIGAIYVRIQDNSITLTNNTYSGGEPGNVYVGRCIFSNNHTLTIDGTPAVDKKPFPVPAE